MPAHSVSFTGFLELFSPPSSRSIFLLHETFFGGGGGEGDCVPSAPGTIMSAVKLGPDVKLRASPLWRSRLKLEGVCSL